MLNVRLGGGPVPKEKVVQLYEFDELEERVQEAVKDRVMESIHEDWHLWQFIIQDFLKPEVEERGYPTDDMRWAFTYSQGDGVAFYGRCKHDGMLFSRLFEHSELEDISKVFERIADLPGYGYWPTMNVEIEKSREFHLYDHQNTMIVTVSEDPGVHGVDYEDEELGDEYREIIEDFQSRVQEDVRTLSRKLHREGYELVEAELRERFDERMAELKEMGHIFLPGGRIVHEAKSNRGDSE